MRKFTNIAGGALALGILTTGFTPLAAKKDCGKKVVKCAVPYALKYGKLRKKGKKYRAKVSKKGHEFWVKPFYRSMKVYSNSVVWTCKGSMSHLLRFRKDDQIRYSFKVKLFRDGKGQRRVKLYSMKIKIKRGGWRQMAAPVNKAIITILTGSPEAGIGASILTHAQGKLVGRLVDGKWEGSMK